MYELFHTLEEYVFFLYNYFQMVLFLFDFLMLSLRK